MDESSEEEISPQEEEVPLQEEEVPLQEEEVPLQEEEYTSSENDDDESDSTASEESPERQLSKDSSKSKDNYRLRKIFARPIHKEPRHPLLSSPFVRHISMRAFGPKKPKWYTPLTSAQLYLFKDIMNYVEIGRGGLFRFDDFMEALQDFDPGINRAEVLSLLDNMQKNEFEELDFGKFLFLLAYNQSQDVEDPGKVNEMLSTSVVTPRQCHILSAISYYVLISSPEEIERYYLANTRRKATILHYHMEASRLEGLTEKQMEEKQKKAMQNLGPIFAVTGSPYACPVPFVPCSKKPKVKLPLPRSSKKSTLRPVTPIKSKHELPENITIKKKEDKTFYDMHYGRLPLPMFNIPENIRKEMRKKCTVVHKDYITRKAYEAIDDYRDRLKEATVIYNKRSLAIILKKGFSSDAEKNAFIEVYERYMPLRKEDVKNFSHWVKPAGYETKHKGKPLYPDKYAFGRTIP